VTSSWVRILPEGRGERKGGGKGVLLYEGNRGGRELFTTDVLARENAHIGRDLDKVKGGTDALTFEGESRCKFAGSPLVEKSDRQARSFGEKAFLKKNVERPSIYTVDREEGRRVRLTSRKRRRLRGRGGAHRRGKGRLPRNCRD